MPRTPSSAADAMNHYARFRLPLDSLQDSNNGEVVLPFREHGPRVDSHRLPSMQDPLNQEEVLHNCQSEL